ncbi:ArsR/SmtB family transcription factor [Geopsychrobacter electrodiphilus]|uniref:ArsR/SmtB family transcription factor n=1 Tax=Geopsychrobacter electrodiphilus TaxID=225196 RepID=UPI0003644431|nr:metalloregulator ArsR/SmtB family transcription factor [Geopsychrobacter electrodiphilus]
MLELFKALADPTRLRLLNILQQGEFTVQELLKILKMGQSRISRHLKILLEAGVLSVKREGTWAYYRLQPTDSLCGLLLPFLKPEFEQLAEAVTDRAAVLSVLAARRERSQLFFDRHARDWDHLARRLLPTPHYVDRLLTSLPLSSCLLEVGVGTGGLLEALRRKSDRVIGVDHAPAMLAAARQRLKGFDPDGIDLRLGEMEHLPLESSSVDTAVLNMVLHHASDPSTVLREIFRVLRPGGVLFIADLLRHQEEWMREKLADQWLGFTPEELFGWGRKAGFNSVMSEPLVGAKLDYTVILTELKKP